MTSKERLDAFYAGKPVDRLPNLTIVGSVVTRYTGIDIETYAKDWQKMADSALIAAEDLDLDFVQIAADLCREAEGYGSKIAYSKTDLPSVEKLALSSIADVDSLTQLKARDIPRLFDMVKATEYILNKSENIYPMTLAVGPMTVAGNLRGVQNIMMDLYDDPVRVNKLLDMVTETTLDYIRELAAVGAKYIYVADPSASLVGPKFYQKNILPRHKKIYALMEELGIGGRLHMCGNTNKILPFSRESGAKIIDIDHDTDFAKAVETLDGYAVANGNIDPIEDVFSGDVERTLTAMRNAKAAAGDKLAMIMPGCELPTATPLENVKAIAAALKEFGNT